MSLSSSARIVSLLLFLGVMALPAVSHGRASPIQPWLPGVTAQGNLSGTLGGQGSGKIYRDTSTGMVIQIVRANVVNDSRRSATFQNTGTIIRDPATNISRAATSDRLVVGRASSIATRNGGTTIARASLVAIINPSLDCSISRASDGTISCSCNE